MLRLRFRPITKDYILKFPDSRGHIISIDGFINTFFGYFDVGPFNPKDENIIAFHATSSNPKRQYPSECAIVLYNLETRTYQVVDTTNACNWQQGARLQWLDSNKLSYNKFINNKPCTVIHNIETGTSEVFKDFIQSATKQYFISLNYSNIKMLRPDYGYEMKSGFEKAELRVYNRNDHSLVRVFSANEFLTLLNRNDPANTVEFNHVVVDSFGKDFIFLVRVYSKVNQYFLMHFNNDNGAIELLKQLDVISHFCWLEDGNVLIWGIDKGRKGYFCISIENQQVLYFLECEFDGHPSRFGTGFLTDTYPDRAGIQQLNVYSGSTVDTKVSLGLFFHPLKFRGNSRCDLHPSLSTSGNRLQIDTIFSGHRKVMIIELSNIR